MLKLLFIINFKPHCENFIFKFKSYCSLHGPFYFRNAKGITINYKNMKEIKNPMELLSLANY